MTHSHYGLGLRSLLANFGKTVGRQLWAAALQLGVVVIVARAYGPEGNGIYSVALLLPTMLYLLLSLGVSPANVFYLASKQYGLRAVATTTTRLWGALSLIGLIGGWATVFFFGDAWFPGVPETTLFLAMLAFPSLLFTLLVGSLFQGIEDFSSFNLTLSLQPAFCLAGITICVVADVPAAYAVGAYTTGSLLSAIIVGARLRRRISSEPVCQAFPVMDALRYGMKSHLGSILSFLNYRVDLFLLNMLTAPATAGVYAIALQISERIWMLSQAVSTVLLPRLAAVGGQKERSAAITAIVCRATMLTTAAMVVGAALAGPWIIGIIFGARYEPAYAPFLVMLPGVLAGSCVRILSAEFSARGRPELNTYMAMLVLAVNIPCNILLIPRYGAVGAALSSTIAYTFNLTVRVRMYRSFTGQPIRSVLIPTRSDFLVLAERLRHGNTRK